jgi:hypothetical protein
MIGALAQSLGVLAEATIILFMIRKMAKAEKLIAMSQ